MRLVMPRLYVILDAGMLTEPAGDTARNLMESGARLMQYRNKSAAAGEMYEETRKLAGIAREWGCRLIVNDRPDVAALAEADGVHVGQEDLRVEQARGVIGPDAWVGVSTHNLEQFEEAAKSSADYIALGPIYPTRSKRNPAPVVGAGLLRQVRGLTKKPIVAIGGITLERASEVIEAGADAAAVMRGILRAADPGHRVQQYLERLYAVKPEATI
jgi:thiamine-phosphate pyrophosphorylase